MKSNWARELFVENANIYQFVLESGLEKAPDEVKGVSIIFDKWSIPPGARILDVSCGIGRHSIQLGKLGFQVVGFDPSKTFINRAKALAKKVGLGEEQARFFHGDISEIAKVLDDSGKWSFLQSSTWTLRSATGKVKMMSNFSGH